MRHTIRGRHTLAILALAITAASLTVATPSTAHVAPRIGTHARARGGASRRDKLPWLSHAARFAPNRVVVVWKHGVSPNAKRATAELFGTQRVSVGRDLGVDVVRVPIGASTTAAIRRFRRSPLVRFAEPDRIATIEGAPLPNDTNFAQQWALNNTGQSHETSNIGLGAGVDKTGTADADIDAPEAWAAQTVHHQTVVAVIDTGVDINHPDLTNRLWVNTAEQGGSGGADDDGNGFVDDLHGWDFSGNDANPTPANGSIEESHGTHLAGIIAAQQGNSAGISGVCPDCRIMALRIGTATSITSGHELQAIDYAIDNGADVINISFGTPVWSKAERSAIARAGKAGILVVIAAGNASTDNDIQFYPDPQHGMFAPVYPASYSLPNILSVAASNDRDQYGYFSQCQGLLPLWQCAFTNWGHDSVDVAAPGVDILSSVAVGHGPGSYADYDVWDGTSMAAPMAAGVAGLVLSEHPGYSAVQVKNAIMRSVNKPASLKLQTEWAGTTHVGKGLLVGHFTRTQGRINALGALTASTANATLKSDGNIDGAKAIGTSHSGSVAWPEDANDVYKRQLHKGGIYQVTLDGPKGSNLDLWIWKPGTKEIFQFTSGCFKSGGPCPAVAALGVKKSSDEMVRFRASKTGTFYFQVNGWYSGGHYKLSIKRLSR